MFRDGNKANNSKSGKDSVLCRIRMIRIKQLNALLEQPLNYSQEFCLYKLLSNIASKQMLVQQLCYAYFHHHLKTLKSAKFI